VSFLVYVWIYGCQHPAVVNSDFGRFGVKNVGFELGFGCRDECVAI